MTLGIASVPTYIALRENVPLVKKDESGDSSDEAVILQTVAVNEKSQSPV